MSEFFETFPFSKHFYQFCSLLKRFRWSFEQFSQYFSILTISKILSTIIVKSRQVITFYSIFIEYVWHNFTIILNNIQIFSPFFTLFSTIFSDKSSEENKFCSWDQNLTNKFLCLIKSDKMHKSYKKINHLSKLEKKFQNIFTVESFSSRKKL